MSVVKHKMFLVLLWFIALMLAGYHGLMAFYQFMPVSFWVEYHEVVPVKDEFTVLERIKFRSHTSLHHGVNMTFNDFLMCKNEIGDLERYSEQRTSNMYSTPKADRFVIWPYSPGPPYPAECCLESDIDLHLPFSTDRTIRYSGCFEGKMFKIVEGP